MTGHNMTRRSPWDLGFYKALTLDALAAKPATVLAHADSGTTPKPLRRMTFTIRGYNGRTSAKELKRLKCGVARAVDDLQIHRLKR